MLQHLLDPDPPRATDAHREAVRERATTLKRRHRRGVVGGVSVAAAVLIAMAAAISNGTTNTRTIKPAGTTTTEVPQPLLPKDATLFEGPIPTVSLQPVLVEGPITISFGSSPERGVELRFEHRESVGWWAGLKSEPPYLRPILNGGVRGHESRGAFRYGVTRGDIVRITLVPGTGDPITVPTIASPEVPAVRFFVVEDPWLPDPEDRSDLSEMSVLYGYSVDGLLVADTSREP